MAAEKNIQHGHNRFGDPSSEYTAWIAAKIRNGEWRAEAPFAGIAGFHLNEIHSSWVKLAEMVRTFLSAKDHGDEAMKTFVNTSLGETWVESGEAPDWQRLYDRRETWSNGTVPAGGLFLTAGADVQKDRVEIDVWAWGRNLESWLIDHMVIDGGPEHAETWAALERVLGQTWTHASGAALKIARLAIDSGCESSAVYTWGRRMGVGQVSPIKGVEGFNRSSPVSGPTYVDATPRPGWRGASSMPVPPRSMATRISRYPTLPAPRSRPMLTPCTENSPPWWPSDGRYLPTLSALITVFDGSGGEPEMLLSPPATIHSRRAEIEVVVQGATPEDRDGMLDGILAVIGDRLATDPTLGGTVDLAMPEPPGFITEAIDGAAGLKGAKVIVALEYTADSPLG